MREIPSRLRIWWSASIAFAAVFIVLVLFAPVGVALVAALLVYGLVLVGGYKRRRSATC